MGCVVHDNLTWRQYCAGGRCTGAGFGWWIGGGGWWVVHDNLTWRQYCAGGRCMGAGFGWGIGGVAWIAYQCS
jgi:hypothetical protein